MSKTTHATANPQAALELLTGYSLEMTGKDVPGLMEAKDSIPAGTKINVTFLGNEDLEMRVARRQGRARARLRPGPAHLRPPPGLARPSSRSSSRACRMSARPSSVFVVGGDPTTPEGPYEDSYDVIRTGLLLDYGVKEVSIAGLPRGSPRHLGRGALAGARGEVARRSTQQGLRGHDPHPVRVRHRPGAGLDRRRSAPAASTARSASARPGPPASSGCSASPAASASARTR